MPLFNISAAARAVCKNRATIARHIKQGRLTATTDDDGNVAIDMSELIRVYGELKNDGESKQQYNSKQQHGDTAAIKNDKDALIATLQHDLEEARDREKWLRERIEFLQSAALPQGGNIETKKGFWERLSQLFGK